MKELLIEEEITKACIEAEEAGDKKELEEKIYEKTYLYIPVNSSMDSDESRKYLQKIVEIDGRDGLQTRALKELCSFTKNR